MAKRVALIVQARMGSTRLPGKILMPLKGKPMLGWQLERLKRAKELDQIILATTDTKGDDAVAALGETCGVTVFRGDEDDVLDRYYRAAKEAGADIIVRVTGDCPLTDPAVVDEVVRHFRSANVDYTKHPENYPEGLDTEVFSFDALERVWREAKLPSEREHVTPFIRNHPELFRVDAPWTSGDISRPTYHWSVDTANDFKFIEAICEHMDTDTFSMRDVIALLERHPEFLEINKGGTGYEGLEKSQKEDKEFKKRHG